MRVFLSKNNENNSLFTLNFQINPLGSDVSLILVEFNQ